MPKRRKKKELPDIIIPIPNPDKEGWHESWYQGRNMLNFPHPYRCILAAKPNGGKTTTILNLILRAKPAFEKIYLIHPDENTQEYDSIEVEYLDEIPDGTFWSGNDVKTMVIIDDIELKNLDKQQQINLDRLFGYCSTHNNISCAITAQDNFNISPSVRRMANVFIVWNTPDKLNIDRIGNRIGFEKKETKKLFLHCKEPTDNIWVDCTKGSPYKIRFNGYTLLA